MIGRRGFLQTLAAAAVGMATFDPKSLLWVPSRATGEVFTVAGNGGQIFDLTSGEFRRQVDEQLELNDLAMKFARAMTDRLERHKSVALREIMFRQSGHIRLPPGILDVTDHGIGEFEPTGTRSMVAALESASVSSQVDHAANLAMAHIRENNVDAFAPIGHEMRPGEAFSGVDAIGLATDPESGLSVRVMRWKQEGGRRRGMRTLTGFELAGGRWVSRDLDFGRGENSFDKRFGLNLERQNAGFTDVGVSPVYDFDYDTD